MRQARVSMLNSSSHPFGELRTGLSQLPSSGEWWNSSRLSLRGAQRRGNHGAAAMMVRWRVLNLNEIANPSIEYGVAVTD